MPQLSFWSCARLASALVVSFSFGCGGAETPRAAAPATAAASSATTTAAAPASSAPVAPATNPPATASSAPAPSPPTPAASAPVEHPKKITARHILIQWMGCQSAEPSIVRTRDQARAVAEDVLRRVKAGEDFARLVIDFSDEPNAGARGGSLGRFGHGAMVKEFEEAAFALKTGEVSAIVESPFGFHIIQRTE